jgi:hypothetical protein
MNIEIHGFAPARSTNVVKAIRQQLKAAGSKNCKIKANIGPVLKDETLTPLIRVYSDKEEDFEFVAANLDSSEIPGATSKIQVQCVLLNRCFRI